MLRRHLHYFHDHLCLNIYYFVADENLLNLGQNTEGIIARYSPPATGAGSTNAMAYTVMVIRYPDADAAQTAHRRFRGAYLPDADALAAVKTEDGKWTGAQVRANYLIGVFDAPSEAHLQAVLRDVNHQLGG